MTKDNPKTKITKEELQSEILRLQQVLDRVPTAKDVREHSKYCHDRFYYMFGSWTVALRSVGLLPSRIGTPIPENELIQDLKKVATIVQHPPTCKEYRKFGQYSISCFHYRFGSWALALQQLGFDIVPEPNWTISELSTKDGAWLSGLADGESSFILSRYNRDYGKQTYACGFVIGFRDDDWKVLEEIRRIWRLQERLTWFDRSGWRNENNAVSLSIQSTVTLSFKVVPTFERFPLRSKKAGDFDLWKQAVEIKFNKLAMGRESQAYTPEEMEQLNSLYEQLKDVKRYKKPEYIT